MVLKLFLLTLQTCCGLFAMAQNAIPQNLSDSIELVKTKMRQQQEVNSYAIGFAGQPSLQFQGFLFLLKSLSNESLVELTKDTSRCLRVYAYTALLHNRYKGIDSIKTKLLKDDTSVPVMFGCIGGDLTVSSLVGNVDSFYHRKMVDQLLAQYDTSNLLWRNRLFEH